LIIGYQRTVIGRRRRSVTIAGAVQASPGGSEAEIAPSGRADAL
jgi:hypothetical protein